MPKASPSAIPRPGPLRELPLDLFLCHHHLPQRPNIRAASGARLLSPTVRRLLADEDLRCARVPPSARGNRLTRVFSPIERKNGLISGARTSRVAALPACRAPAVDSFRCAHVPPCGRDNRLTRWTRFSSSTEQFAEEGLVFGVRTLHVGAPPALTSTPCPVSSGARSNSPRPSATDTQSIHYPGFQVYFVDASTFTGSLIIHHSETPQSEKENAPPGRRPCKSASVTPPAPHRCFVGPL
ncbi:hypothetical protein B0H13DRAFT_750229 [Mycena leptocephala]|nr:hypothetical protein B0H13DRAFT_750229 [Mycena leptocephala]